MKRQRIRRVRLPACGLAIVVVGAVVSCIGASAQASGPFSFDRMVERGMELGAHAFEPAPEPLVGEQDRLNYDEYRQIRFDEEQAIWRDAGAGFEVQFYHCGYIFLHPIEINLIEAGQVRAYPFTAGLFSSQTRLIAQKAAAIDGFAGFKVLYAINKTERLDEFLSFLGASYFRAVQRGGVYGASARGLALNTGLGKPEEFRSFWLERPDAGRGMLRIYALLDGPSVTGAFQFGCQPGEETVIDVDARFFPRTQVEEFCVAPITSEFFYGEGQARDLQINRRPEIHDSDGLLMASGTGEWIWRPLRNPSSNRLDVYAVDTLRGFGLMQRDREPKHYADLNAPELRPSVWVEPLEGFAAGSVRLLELSALDESLDNVTAFWVPAQPPGVGEDRRVRYRLHFSMKDPAGHSGATVTRTVRKVCGPDCTRYAVDFTRGDGPAPPPQPAIRAVVTATGGEVRNSTVKTLDNVRAFRAEFEVTRPAGSKVMLRCFLRAGPDTLSETWSDTWES